ncbi:MAG: 16S rRNA (cytidine(1402)-2'-O)-methyltransferase, partial [Alphaproteobacteria bacterium]
IISTPIGHLGDISIRALTTLKSLDKVYCEDTRVTTKLLQRYNIKKTLFKYNDFSSEVSRKNIIKNIEENQSVGLVSDAGTPLISDPGYKLVRECMNQNIPVNVIPGPSALISSIVLSGLPSNKIYFTGFLPTSSSKRTIEFEKIKKLDATIIIFETTKKLNRTLLDLKKYFGNIKIVITREITKIYEEVIVEEIDSYIKKMDNKTLKGEIVLLFNTADMKPFTDMHELEEEIKKLINNLPVKEITNMLYIKYDISKKAIYDMCLKLKSNS